MEEEEVKDKTKPSVLIIVTDEAGVTTTIDTSEVSAHSLGGHILHATQRMQAAFAPEVQRTIDDITQTYEEAMRVWDTLKKVLAGAGTPEPPGGDEDESEAPPFTDPRHELDPEVAERLVADEESAQSDVPLTTEEPEAAQPSPVTVVSEDPELADRETAAKLADERQGSWRPQLDASSDVDTERRLGIF